MGILQDARLGDVFAAVLKLPVVEIPGTGCGVEKVVGEKLKDEDEGEGNEMEEVKKGASEKAGNEVDNGGKGDDEAETSETSCICFDEAFGGGIGHGCDGSGYAAVDAMHSSVEYQGSKSRGGRTPDGSSRKIMKGGKTVGLP